MTSRDFCYWLQGYLEIGQADKNKGAETISREQVECIQKHLRMVFKLDIDPSHGPITVQDSLNHIHGAPEGSVLMRC